MNIQFLSKISFSFLLQKINEENSAKTSSETAASAGPSTSTEPAEEDKDKEDDKDSKKKKNRCSECRKKVGLTGTYYQYCRYPDITIQQLLDMKN